MNDIENPARRPRPRALVDPDRRRPRPRPLRPRAARRHAADHARHPARLASSGVTLDIARRSSTAWSHKELDQDDPIPLRSTRLEVTSPGVERSLRTPGALPARGRQGRGHPPRRRRPPTSAGSRASSSPPTTPASPCASTTGDRTHRLRPDRPGPHRVRVGPHTQAGPRAEEGTDHACRATGRGSIRRRSCR